MTRSKADKEKMDLIDKALFKAFKITKKDPNRSVIVCTGKGSDTTAHRIRYALAADEHGPRERCEVLGPNDDAPKDKRAMHVIIHVNDGVPRL